MMSTYDCIYFKVANTVLSFNNFGTLINRDSINNDASTLIAVTSIVILFIFVTEMFVESATS